MLISFLITIAVFETAGSSNPSPLISKDIAFLKCSEVLRAAATQTSIRDAFLFQMLRHKYLIRLLFDGGPIQQPDFFYPIRANLIEDAKNTLIFLGIPAEAVDKANLIESKNAVSLLKRSPHGIVVKPNQGANGLRITFIERADSGVRITLYSKYSSGLSAELRISLSRFGTFPISASPNEDIVSLKIPADLASEVSAIVLNTLAVDRTPGRIEYDSGLVEALVPGIKISGRAYETRHYFRGTFGSEEILFPGDPNYPSDCEIESFSRIGSSRYFANVIGRDKAQLIPRAQMYDPILNQLNVGYSPETLDQMIRDLIKEQWKLVNQRLVKANLVNGEGFVGEIDLIWTDSERSLPIPVMVEAQFHAY